MNPLQCAVEKRTGVPADTMAIPRERWCTPAVMALISCGLARQPTPDLNAEYRLQHEDVLFPTHNTGMAPDSWIYRDPVVPNSGNARWSENTGR